MEADMPECCRTYLRISQILIAGHRSGENVIKMVIIKLSRAGYYNVLLYKGYHTPE
jgi:hypothetical protein